MIILIGGSGYVGREFSRIMESRNIECKTLSRQFIDYTSYGELVAFLREIRPHFLINAAGFTGKPNVDACEIAKVETLQGNAILPLTISHACEAAGVPWGHVSSGCIYQGAYIKQGDAWVVEKDLSRIASSIATKDVEVKGFSEADPPNFSFRHSPCSFYSGTKALAEESLVMDQQVYIWRLRIPFNEIDHPRNYLTKLQTYSKVYCNVNSLSHLHDFVNACLDLWQIQAPYGIYNVTNPGYLSTQEVVSRLEVHLKPNRKFEFWTDDAEFYNTAAIARRSNCILDTTKVLSAGVAIRPVNEALENALSHWKPSISHS